MVRSFITYLHSKQIQYLDKIIISHGDNDHIGGLNSVLKAFNALEILTSVPNKIKATTTLCKKGQHWIWDDVLCEILNPDDNLKGNNVSCVLKISTNSHSILLSGDIVIYSLAHIMVIKLHQVTWFHPNGLLFLASIKIDLSTLLRSL